MATGHRQTTILTNRANALRAIALMTGSPAALLAYGRVEIERAMAEPRKQGPPPCWNCRGALSNADHCPNCGADIVPF